MTICGRIWQKYQDLDTINGNKNVIFFVLGVEIGAIICYNSREMLKKMLSEGASIYI